MKNSLKIAFYILSIAPTMVSSLGYATAQPDKPTGYGTEEPNKYHVVVTHDAHVPTHAGELATIFFNDYARTKKREQRLKLLEGAPSTFSLDDAYMSHNRKKAIGKLMVKDKIVSTIGTHDIPKPDYLVHLKSLSSAAEKSDFTKSLLSREGLDKISTIKNIAPILIDLMLDDSLSEEDRNYFEKIITGAYSLRVLAEAGNVLGAEMLQLSR